jgi:hypothetical protein
LSYIELSNNEVIQACNLELKRRDRYLEQKNAEKLEKFRDYYLKTNLNSIFHWSSFFADESEWSDHRIHEFLKSEVTTIDGVH